MSLLDHALKYAADGWAVFPCVEDGKIPACENGVKDATTDPDKIRALWSANANFNIGFDPHSKGWCVLDIDPPIGEDSLFTLECEHGFLPKTREHKTGRGGRHIIFAGVLPPTVGKLGPKIDTRGSGTSYIVIPPSTFEGGSYVVTEDRPIVAIPGYLSTLAGERRVAAQAATEVKLDDDIAIARGRRLLADYVQRGHVAREHEGGDNRTYAVAAEILNLGLTPDAAFDLMVDWNAACVPPWDEEELRSKIANASAYAQNETGAWSVPPVRERFSDDTLDRLIAEADASPAPPEGDSARFTWLSEAEFSTMKPPAWLIPDLLTRESIAMLYGPSGHYKSFLALNIAAQVAQRGELAFYVAAEGISRMARQDFPAWKMANGEERTIPFYMVEDMPLTTIPGDMDEFIRSIDAVARREQKHVGVIFLDTLNTAMVGLEENSAKDAGLMIQAIKHIKKTFKTTVVVVHHTPKDGSEPRGSGAFYAGFDTVLKVIADHSVKLAKMFVTKQKNAEARPHPFCFEGRRVGPGLAFAPIDNKKAALLSDEADIFGPKNVSECLVNLKAFNPVHVTSAILLGELIPQLENETAQQREDTIARASKGLAAAVKSKRLDGYCEGIGRGVRWMLPAPK
jgi:hypothetical protein